MLHHRRFGHRPGPITRRRWRGLRLALLLVAGLFGSPLAPAAFAQQWSGYAGNAQHTALSPTASQTLSAIRWSTPVDLAPQYSGNDLLIHYGSPSITAANTVIVPVKTGPSGGFTLKAFDGANGTLKWTQSTDYSLPPSGGATGWSWTPSYSPTLTPASSRLYYAGQGGAVNYISSLDTSPTAPTQVFVTGAFNSNIAINTPLTSDASGNIYFGFQDAVTNTSGLARVDPSGAVTTLAASSVAAGLKQVVTNAAPAVATDGSVYVAMSNGNFSTGRLVKVNFDGSNLVVSASVVLKDPKTNSAALLPNVGTASPMIGPDGDVYMGVFDNAGTSRGWMEHYNSSLTTTFTAGGFGWDDTASIVPASMVPSYTGSSPYLLMTKYNNYKETGGLGQNRIAILDPGSSVLDDITQRNNPTNINVMAVVMSILGPTPDSPGFTEWCINTAVVDPATDSVLVNSEDGKLYRWSLATNTLSQTIKLTDGLGEAYTPTLIGPDGTVYAISNAQLFAIGIPEPASATLLLAAAGILNLRRPARRA